MSAPGRRRHGAWLVVCLWLAAGASAEVTSSGPGGFVSEHELIVDGTPERVFTALTVEVASWWDATHSYSGDAANFSLTPEPGGCFCERLPGGGGVEHMRVVFAQPGRLLRLEGGLGPLQGMGVSGAMDFALEPAGEDRTRLRYRYAVSGFAPGGLEALAMPVDQVQLGQLQRLAAHLSNPR
ncbi:MAG: hypothetical protein RIB46_21800 [Pseudomonadales bacterium]